MFAERTIIIKTHRNVRGANNDDKGARMEFNIEMAIPMLQATPNVVSAMLAGLDDAWVQTNYGPETFCPFDVIGHLIHGEREDWVPRAKIILEFGEDRVFDQFDRYAMFKDSKGKTIHELLATFSRLRAENVDALRALELTPADLLKTGTHPVFGAVTLKSLLATWVAHDQNHIHQIAKCLAYQYREAVGPWDEYLTFVSR